MPLSIDHGTKVFHRLAEGPRAVFFLFIGLHAIIQYPIFHNSLPMLSDYPNHLARMHILATAGQSIILNTFYAINWTAVPNLAMDLVVPWLSVIVGINVAGKLFLGLTLLLISSGTMQVHYALHQRRSFWPLTVFLILYNTMFLYGLVNFMFGMGLALWIFSAWVHLRRNPHWWQLMALPLFAMTVFFCHLSAFGFLMFVTLLYELSCRDNERENIKNWGAFVSWTITAALSAYVLLILSPAKNLQDYDWTITWFDTYLESIFAKPLLLLVLFYNYDLYLDAFTVFVVSVFVIKAIRSNALAIRKDMALPLIGIGAVVLLMPRVLYGSALADARLFVALAFLFISSTDLTLPHRPKFIFLMTCSIALIFLLRTGVILTNWSEADSVTADAVGALKKMEIGQRLLVIHDEHKGEHSFLENFEKFLPCLAIISRSAFVPTLYALPGAQPVSFTPEYAKLRATIPTSAISDRGTEWSDAINNYDYVWIAESPQYARRVPAKMEIIVSDPRFQFYRVTRQ